MANDEEMALTALREELERVTAEKDAACRELETLNAREEVTRVEVDQPVGGLPRDKEGGPNHKV